MFLSLDGTFWVQVLNFAVFYAILTAVFLRPVQRAIAKRREYIESVTSDYDKAQAESAALRAEAARIHQDARREADQILADARARAGDESARLAADYSRNAQALVEKAQQAVQGEIDAARAHGDRLAGALAEGVVAKILPGTAA